MCQACIDNKKRTAKQINEQTQRFFFQEGYVLLRQAYDEQLCNNTDGLVHELDVVSSFDTKLMAYITMTKLVLKITFVFRQATQS